MLNSLCVPVRIHMKYYKTSHAETVIFSALSINNDTAFQSYALH